MCRPSELGCHVVRHNEDKITNGQRISGTVTIFFKTKLNEI